MQYNIFFITHNNYHIAITTSTLNAANMTVNVCTAWPRRRPFFIDRVSSTGIQIPHSPGNIWDEEIYDTQ